MRPGKARIGLTRDLDQFVFDTLLVELLACLVQCIQVLEGANAHPVKGIGIVNGDLLNTRFKTL